MAYATPASRYREAEVLSATPGQLVVIIYDFLLTNLLRARVAIEDGDPEVRAVALDRCRGALGELLATLDMEKGGDVAKRLGALYSFLLAELVDVGMRGDAVRVERVRHMVTGLRDAFAQIAGPSTQTASVA